jgi:uncharacterized protein (DUF1778 family)
MRRSGFATLRNASASLRDAPHASPMLAPGQDRPGVCHIEQAYARPVRWNHCAPDLSGRMPYTLRMASSPATKTRRIEIRITEEERNLEQAAAAVSGETLSEFVRRAARHEAERTLAERTRYILDDEAAQRFLTALEQPSPASERGLRRLTEKPSVLPEA